MPYGLDKENAPQAVRDLFANAQELLHEIVQKKLFEAQAVYGFFPANSDGMISLYAPIRRADKNWSGFRRCDNRRKAGAVNPSRPAGFVPRQATPRTRTIPKNQSFNESHLEQFPRSYSSSFRRFEKSRNV